MTNQSERPDPNLVLDGLKDFQRRTVDYTFQRLYVDPDRADRFLVADEVGLGKTLVARGLIARVLEHLWDDVARIDIVYVCSNADIARQNVNRLSIPGMDHPSIASRLTLLPIKIQNLKRNKVNFISFTPGTSFNLQSTEGIAEERALLYLMLEKIWKFKGKSPLNVLQGDMSAANFREWVDWSRRNRSIDKGLLAAFAAKLERDANEARPGQLSLRERFDEACEKFGRARKHIPNNERLLRRSVVGDLRRCLADTCLNELEPDLIILDEFQRFRDLFTGNSEASKLAQTLLNYKDAKTLLLSATPYKMYTTRDGVESDDHYKDFLETLQILFNHDNRRKQAFEAALHRYRRGLFRLIDADAKSTRELKKAKREVEAHLRRVMVRSERLAVTGNRNGMLQVAADHEVRLAEEDLSSYLMLDRVGRHLNQHSVMEYWKSSPYLLNFMESHYQFKRLFVEEIHQPTSNGELRQILSGYGNHSLLSWSDIEAYRRVDPANARLRQLWADTVDSDAWQLLWIPPTLPYYKLAPPFSQANAHKITKRLVFSSWHVVPKVVASLLSYEAERHMVGLLDDSAENNTEARKKRGNLLRFTHGRDGRLTGMPVLGILYPSTVLAKLGDPLRYAAEDLTLQDLRDLVRTQLAELVDSLELSVNADGPADESWYWAMPILLDLQANPEAVKNWWQEPGLASNWSGTDVDSDEDEDATVWAEHVAEARRVCDAQLPYGRLPSDLLDVLAEMAIAGPGIVAYRAISRVIGGDSYAEDGHLQIQAATVAWAFRSLFNVPEVVALLRGLDREISYWRQVLAYSAAGGLQAVMDEYAHVLREALGLLSLDERETVEKLAGGMRAAIQIRPALLKVDEVDPTEVDEPIIDRRLRTHFALRFGDHRSDDDKKQYRKEQVRDAFNSPFWPFVVVTTSVGQEGLDFHLYCHAVVHWNLPSNPVDLEQREGRVHRYKGHAVRKNVAAHWKAAIWQQVHTDPWQALFDLAQQKRQAESSDLVPFWIYPETGEGVATIERHVPALPLSKEVGQLSDLSRSLMVYRMAFGQNRQDDLVHFLLENVSEKKLLRFLEEVQIDLSPF